MFEVFSCSLCCYDTYTLSCLWRLLNMENETWTPWRPRETLALLKSYYTGMVYFKQIKNVGIQKHAGVMTWRASRCVAIDGPSGSLSNSVNCVSVRLRAYSIRFSSIAMNPQSSVLKYYGCGSAKNFSIFFCRSHSIRWHLARLQLALVKIVLSDCIPIRLVQLPSIKLEGAIPWGYFILSISTHATLCTARVIIKSASADGSMWNVTHTNEFPSGSRKCDWNTLGNRAEFRLKRSDSGLIKCIQEIKYSHAQLL